MLTDSELQNEVSKLSKDKNVYRWLRAALIDWAIIVMTFYVAHQAHNWFVYFIAVFILGVMIHALGVLGHEGVHYLICNNRKLNNFLANFFCYWPIGILTLEGYRNFHITHHYWTNTEKDPELVHKRAVPEWGLPMKRTQMLTNLLRDLFTVRISHLIQVFLVTRAPSIRYATGTTIFWIVAEIVCFVLGAPYILMLWVFAHLTSAWAILRLRTYHEHLGTIKVNRVHIPWWYSSVIAQHNIWIHQEHHEWPTVPFYHLPKLRELTKGNPPIVPIFDLYKSFETHTPVLSGTPLRKAEEVKTELSPNASLII